MALRNTLAEYRQDLHLTKESRCAYEPGEAHMDPHEEEQEAHHVLIGSKPKSSFTIHEDILLQTPPSSRAHLTDDEEILADPTARYSVIYQGHTVHIDPIDWRHSPLLRSQIALCFFTFALSGLADQTIGTLMPILVKHFDTSQTRITTIFAVSFCGYATSAFANESLHAKIGRRGVLLIGSCGPLLAYTVNSLQNNLALFVAMYAVNGLGSGLVGGTINVFLSSISDHNELMGLLHGFYGVGSIISPPLVSWIAEKWGFQAFYSILAVSYFLCLLSVIHLYSHETKWKYAYLTRFNQDAQHSDSPGLANSLAMLKNRTIQAFCAYLFFYVGGEIAIGSWLLTYLRQLRGMEQIEASLIVSWFWFGLTFGRMTLGFATKKFRSEYLANTIYGWLSWVSFSSYMVFSMFYTGDSYASLCRPLIFVMGVFIGPLFPTASVVLLKLLPAHQQVSGVGIASSIGGSGSAIVPFIVGTLSRWLGFKWMLMIVDVVILAYCVVWALVPRIASTSNADW